LINSNTKQWISLFFIICLLFQNASLKADENAFGYRIFVMQEKQANRGNTLAQFKLGTFYEFGISVKPDAEKAKMWYEKAVKKKNRAATNRLIYLDIKQNGYEAPLHASWLTNISAKAKNANANALIILGQLHQHGLGVNKDLKKALGFLEHASSLGHTELYKEIANINKQINPEINKPPVKKAEVTTKNDKAKAKPVKAPTKQKPKKAKKKAKVQKVDKTAQKRKKYEETMRKLYLENLILQEQQEWTEDETE